jgi:hypothetical protein
MPRAATPLLHALLSVLGYCTLGSAAPVTQDQTFADGIIKIKVDAEVIALGEGDQFADVLGGDKAVGLVVAAKARHDFL